MVKKKHFQLVIYASVFLAFLLLGTFAGLHHEPWADEAQSWLIARDNNSLIDIIKAVRYEGTLPTWSLIIKLFQICGLDYDHIFVISLFFSAIGVILLLMSNSPESIKILLPFSFYTIFQNTVVARQYALVFPAMMLIVLFYKNRLFSPIKYYVSLIVLGLTSSYGIIISCSFMLWDFICMFNKKSSKNYDNRFRMCFYSTAVIFLAMILASFPPSDIGYVNTKISFIDSFSTTFVFHIDNIVFQHIITIAVISSLCYYFKRNLFQFVIIFLPVSLYMAFFYHRLWHTCYLFYLVIILIILLGEKREEKERVTTTNRARIANMAIGSMLTLQCIAGLYSIYIDYAHPYNTAKTVSEFITPYVNSGASIDMYGYIAFGVQPYFNSNIFANYHSDKAYYVWSTNNSLLKLSTPTSDLIISFAKNDDFEMSNFKDEIKDYKAYLFPGKMIFKFHPAENNDIYVLVKGGTKSTK